MYRCCIFDLDGTLVNSVYAIQKATSETLAHFHLEPVSEEETKLFAGDGYKKLVERAMEAIKAAGEAPYVVGSIEKGQKDVVLC